MKPLKIKNLDCRSLIFLEVLWSVLFCLAMNWWLMYAPYNPSIGSWLSAPFWIGIIVFIAGGLGVSYLKAKVSFSDVKFMRIFWGYVALTILIFGIAILIGALEIAQNIRA